MKYLRQHWLIGIFTLFASLHALWALDEVPVYDEAKTDELRRYLTGVLKGIPETAESSRIKELIMQGADPNLRTDPALGVSCSAIHLAADTGEGDLIQFLYDHNADIEAKTGNGNTPLHWAVCAGQMEAIDLLVRLGANIDLKNVAGETPLHLATSNMLKKAIKILISLGANIDELDSFNSTPLFWMALNGQWEAVLYFLSLGSKDGENAFRIFLDDDVNVLSPYFSKAETLQDELWLNALIRLKKEDLTSIDASIDEIKPIINQCDAYKNTPLDVAIVSRNGLVIPALLFLGADPWAGLFDGVFLASRIPEFNEKKDGKPSIYEQIRYLPLRRCWLIKHALQEALYKDVLNQIVKFEIDCRRKFKNNFNLRGH